MIFLRLYFCFFLLCFGNYSLLAQQNPKETSKTLIQRISHLKNSREKVDLLNQLVLKFRDEGDRNASVKHALQAKKMAKSLNYEKGLTDAYLNLGVTYREMNRFPEAESSLKEHLKLCEKTADQVGKGNAYDNLGHLFLAKGDTAGALENHLKSLEIREKIGDDYGIGNSNDNIAQIYAARVDFLNSVRYFEAALKVFERIGDESRIALGAANLGTQYYYMGNYHTALRNQYKSLESYKRTKNPDGEIWTCQLIGNIYSDAGNFDLALKNYRKVLKIGKKTGNWWNSVDSYTLIGRTYMMMEDFPKAHYYFQKALQLSEENEEPLRIMIAVYFIADTYRDQKMTDKSLEWFNRAFKMASEQNNTQWKGSIGERIGRIHFDKKNYSEAKKWLVNSLKIHQELQIVRDLSQNYHILSDVNNALGEYKEAYENYRMYVKYNEVIKKNDASKLLMKHEFKKREDASRLYQEKKDLLASKEIRTKSIQRNAAIGGLTLVTLLLLSVLYLFRLRSKKLAAEKLNSELKRREVEAVKETEKFKSQFLTNISHEFRTPLTLINGNLELLKQTAENEQQISRYQEMENNGKHLLQLINHLLDLSKMESGQYELQFRNGNLINEIQAYVETFHSHAAQLGIRLTVEISQITKEKISQNPFYYSSEALNAILGNLLSNALKFTPADGTVHTRIDFLNDQLFISVTDSGIGIPEEQLMKVFDRFHQVDSFNKRFQSGSGIGLAIVKELVTMHGGAVSVENGVENGCVFSVFLANMNQNTEEFEAQKTGSEPVYPLEEIYSQEQVETEDKSTELPVVLVVEDQEQLRKFICECLGDQYLYLEASDGIQGIEMAKNSLPDLVISDVMMPGKNGEELCYELKNNDLTSHIPIILLTAKADQKDKESGLETGADDYLTKPFSVSELKFRVRNMLRIREVVRDKLSDGKQTPLDELPELYTRDREFLQKLRTIVGENISNQQFGVNPLAESVYLSSSQLTRKLKALIGNTPADFIRTIRLQKSLKLLQDGMSVSEVAWAVGFDDPSYFGKVFKKQFGYPPSEMEKGTAT